MQCVPVAYCSTINSKNYIKWLLWQEHFSLLRNFSKLYKCLAMLILKLEEKTVKEMPKKDLLYLSKVHRTLVSRLTENFP